VQLKNHYQFENHSSIEVKAERLLVLKCEVLALEKNSYYTLTNRLDLKILETTSFKF
jgi:hypothetical protein